MSKNIGKYMMQYGLLSILCIISFLTAKYIVRSNIVGEQPPVDTSGYVRK